MQLRFALAGVLAGAALLAGAAPVSAACAMRTVPVPMKMQGMQPIVPATVDGREARFLVDSGAAGSTINFKFAKDMKVKKQMVEQTGSHMLTQAGQRVEGVAGVENMSAVVQAEELNLGGFKFKQWGFMTFNGPDSQAGLLGQDILQHMDVEYDFGHDSLKLVLVQDCKDATLAYWATGVPYSVVPLLHPEQNNEHTEAFITINGVKLTATFDTGAESSFITEAAAARAGVKITDPGVTEGRFATGVDGRRVKTWNAHFASVKIGDEEIRNGLLDIGRTTADFDILIGADFFLSHHVYVANSQRKIYFTYNGGRVFNVANHGDALMGPPAATVR